MQNWKDWKRPFRIILSHFGGKRLEKLWIRWNWPFQVIMSHFGGKRLEKLWIRWNWPFQVILRYFSGKRLEKLRIWWNWPFPVIPSHFGGKRWATLVGKVVNRAKLAVASHSEPLQWKRLEKLRVRWNWPFWVILSHFGGKRLEKLQLGQNPTFPGGGDYISQKHNVMLTQNSSWIWKTDVFFSVYSTNNEAIGLMAQLSM